MDKEKKDEFQLSVVIPTHNKPDDLIRCIESIIPMPFKHGKYEIVVVDDGSINPIKSKVQSINSKGINIKCIRLEGKGPACARNAGILASIGEVIAFCDDDALPQTNYLNEIYEPFISCNDVIGVEGAVIPVGGEDFGPLGMSPDNQSGKVFLTCNIAFKKNALNAVGGLDQSFRFPAFEDCDLAAVIKKHGKIVWRPKAIVHHPRRCWNLKRAIREIEFNEPLVLFARRYGYLGWPHKKTNLPWLKIYYAAVFTLPLGRTMNALQKINFTNSFTTLQYITISLIQGLIASIKVIPAIIRGYKIPVTRKKYI